MRNEQKYSSCREGMKGWGQLEESCESPAKDLDCSLGSGESRPIDEGGRKSGIQALF